MQSTCPTPKVIDIKNFTPSEKWLKSYRMSEANAWREGRIAELSREIDCLESEIQIASRSNLSTDGGWQLKKKLLKSRRKTLEDSLDRIGTNQCICDEEKSCNRIHLRETAVQVLNILWYLIVLFFLVDTIWNPFGMWTKK